MLNLGAEGGPELHQKASIADEIGFLSRRCVTKFTSLLIFCQAFLLLSRVQSQTK